MTTTTAATLPSPDAKSSIAIRQPALAKVFGFAARVQLALLFLLAGVGKISGYSATAAYMASAGVPAALLPVVIALEVGGSLAIITGWRTRIAAFLLAGFSLLSAAIFHNHLADQVQLIMFWKDVAIAGGLLLLVVHGAGPWSLDRRAGRS